MQNESELNLLGTAVDLLSESDHPDDRDVVKLLSVALRLRGDRGDITYRLGAKPPLQLADLKTPDHFRQYFIYRLGMCLGEEPKLLLPSQEHVDQGKRIEDAGFTTYQPVACPELTIVKGYQYPANWQFPLDPWVYEQIANRNLAPGVLNLRQMYGWLDVSPGLDWKSNDPMLDPNMDQKMAELIVGLREKGEKGGIAVPSHVRHLDNKSPYGISADEGKNAVYPALAEIFGANKGGVRNLKAAELNFIGNYLYFDSNGEINLGGANSWVWLDEVFGTGSRLIGGYRDNGGLSYVRNYPSDNHDDDIRLRPLVVSPSTA